MYHFPAFPMFLTQDIKITVPVLSYSQKLHPVMLAKQSHTFFCLNAVFVRILCDYSTLTLSQSSFVCTE